MLINDYISTKSRSFLRVGEMFQILGALKSDIPVTSDNGEEKRKDLWFSPGGH